MAKSEPTRALVMKTEMEEVDLEEEEELLFVDFLKYIVY